MAIVASNLYSGRVITGDTGYPLGKAQDIVNGEKGTGTPLRASWVNDQWGFLQALLDAADITPSGTPDQVGQSDYLDAVNKLIREPLALKIFQSPSSEGLTEIQTRTVNANEVYEVRKTSDGSLATIYSNAAGTTEIVQNGTSNVSDSAGVVEFFVADGNYCIYTQYSNKTFYISKDNSVRLSQYGVIGQDLTQVMLDMAARSSGKNVVFDKEFEGYITQEINFKDPASIDFGENLRLGFDASSVSTAISLGEEVIEEIKTLLSTVDKHTKDLSVDDASGVEAGGFISIWNPVDGSWSSFRDNYRQGEYVQVLEVNGNTILLRSGLQDSYPEGSKIFYFAAPKITVKGNLETTNTGDYGVCTGLSIMQFNKLNLDDLKVHSFNGTTALRLFRCINGSGGRLDIKQQSSKVSGLNYGLAYSSCQNIEINGVFHAERHAVTIGGGGSDGVAINRDILTTGVFTTSGQGSVQAADIHGNAERCGYGGYLEGYIIGGHDSYLLKGTKVVSPKSNVSAIQGSEMLSTKHNISGAQIVQIGTPNGRGAVEIGGNTSPIDSRTKLGGVFNASNCDIRGADTTQGAIRFRNRGFIGDIHLDLSGITVNTPNSSNAFVFSEASGSPITSVNFTSSEAWKEGVSSGGTEKYIGIEQHGNGTIDIDATGNIFYNTISYDFQFLAGRTYTVEFNADRHTIGSQLVVRFTYNQNSSGFTAAIASSDRVNFDRETSVNFYWVAKCS